MTRFHDILVIPASLRPEDPALVRALALASTDPVAITVGWPVEDADSLLNDRMREAVLDQARTELAALVTPLFQQGINIQPCLITGRTYMTVITRVMTKDHDLVIKTARGRQLQPNLFFGSTALHLLRKCPCPVWVVDDQGPARPGPVLAAIDPASDDTDAAGLAERIVSLAATLAQADKVPLHVAHAWTAPYEDTLRTSGFLRVSEQELRTYVNEAEDQHRRAFARVMEPYHGLATAHLVKGRPDRVICDLCADLGITTLVIGTVARSGVPGLLVGNTAETLLAQVRCSVLAIKPPGFVSPVQLS